MRRWLVRLLSGLLSAAAILVLLAWLTLRASLPRLEGTLELSGIAAPVSITRDAAGVPTITAGNRLDLAFATGFAHGQDRFFQMDLVRRDAAGELSEIIGAATVVADRERRLHRFRSRAQLALSAFSQEERELLEHYAAGVNAGLGSLGSKPFEYYLLRVTPRPWTAEDSMLVAYAMFLQLNDERAGRDMQRGLAANILPREVYAWMYPPGTSWDAPVLGAAMPDVPIPGPEIYSVREFSVAASRPIESAQDNIPGSNNWVVSAAHSESGLPIVSNDMHLGLDVPNIWYRARLISTGSPSLQLTGVTLPGQPLMVAGSNGHIAWGFTNSQGDWSDAVMLRPGQAPGSYLTANGERVFDTFDEVIYVKDAAAEHLHVRDTIWGPVLDDVQYPGSEIAVSWVAHETAGTNLRLLQLEGADNTLAALDIANHATIPPQNFVVADSAGNIGWTIAGRIPLRGAENSQVPMDWSVTPGWQGWLDANDYPRIVNPPAGRIWSANARVVDGEMLRLLGDGGYDIGARAAQIRDALYASEQFTPQHMLDIQLDDRALFLARWQSLLLEVLARASADDPQLDEYRQLVAAWSARAEPRSAAYRLVRTFRSDVRQRIFDALMTPVREAYGEQVPLYIGNQFEGSLWALLQQRPPHLLPAGFASWDDFLLDVVRDNIQYFTTNFHGPLAERTWGERNMASIRHPLSRAVPMLSGWLDMPAAPLGGDRDMPKVLGPTFGASERFSVSPGDEAHGLMHMPGGQSGHPLSPFYGAGHEAWVRGDATPFLPGAPQYELILQAATR